MVYAHSASTTSYLLTNTIKYYVHIKNWKSCDQSRHIRTVIGNNNNGHGINVQQNNCQNKTGNEKLVQQKKTAKVRHYAYFCEN